MLINDLDSRLPLISGTLPQRLDAPRGGNAGSYVTRVSRESISGETLGVDLISAYQDCELIASRARMTTGDFRRVQREREIPDCEFSADAEDVTDTRLNVPRND